MLHIMFLDSKTKSMKFSEEMLLILFFFLSVWWFSISWISFVSSAWLVQLKKNASEEHFSNIRANRFHMAETSHSHAHIYRTQRWRRLHCTACYTCYCWYIRMPQHMCRRCSYSQRMGKNVPSKHENIEVQFRNRFQSVPKWNRIQLSFQFIDCKPSIARSTWSTWNQMFKLSRRKAPQTHKCLYNYQKLSSDFGHR